MFLTILNILELIVIFNLIWRRFFGTVKYFIKLPSWMIIFGLTTLFCFCPTSAVGITGLTLFTDELELKLNSWNLVPCRFYSDTPILPNQLHLEWGKTIDEGRTYIPLIQIFGKTVKKSTKRHQVYVNIISNGNCSLVINPAKSMDSGIYEVRLTLDGVLYKPIPKIRVQPLTSDTTVRLQKRDATFLEEKSQQELKYTETEKETYIFLKYEKYYITAIVILTLFTLLGPLGWYLYFMEIRRLQKKQLLGEPIKLNERTEEENIEKGAKNEAKENQNPGPPTEEPDTIKKPLNKTQEENIQKGAKNEAKENQNPGPPTKEPDTIKKTLKKTQEENIQKGAKNETKVNSYQNPGPPTEEPDKITKPKKKVKIKLKSKKKLKTGNTANPTEEN